MEFHKTWVSTGILAAYVDLKKTSDSVHREALWDLLRLHGIPPGIIGIPSFFSCAYGSEAGLHPCSITFQYMYSLGTGQSYGPKSLLIICRQ